MARYCSVAPHLFLFSLVAHALQIQRIFVGGGGNLGPKFTRLPLALASCLESKINLGKIVISVDALVIVNPCCH